jgi:hypothetical protein
MNGSMNGFEIIVTAIGADVIYKLAIPDYFLYS